MENFTYKNDTSDIITVVSKGVIEFNGNFRTDDIEGLNDFNKWLDAYLNNPNCITEVYFHFTNKLQEPVYNIICNITKQLNAFAHENAMLITWNYNSSAIDVLNMGKQLDELFDEGFEFEKIIDTKTSPIDLIKKANDAIEGGLKAQGFKCYGKYVDYNNEKWKQPFIYKMANKVIHSTTQPVFVGKDFDLILTTEKDISDDEFTYGIYLIYFFESSQSSTISRSRYETVLQRRDEVKETIDMVLDDDYDISVKSLIVAKDNDDRFMEHNMLEFDNNLCFYSTLEAFNLEVFLPQDELDEVSDDFKDFSIALGNFLIESEGENNENINEYPDEVTEVITPKEPIFASSKVKNIASTHFNDFVDKSVIAFSGYSNNEVIFKMSPNMVFLTHGNIETTKLAKYYSNVALINFSVSVDGFDFRTIDSLSELKSKLRAFSDNIVVIENLDKELNAERNLTLDVTRKDMINALCDHIEKDKRNFYTLGLSAQSWESLSAQYQNLRICFQHVFEFSEYKASHMLDYYIKELEKIDSQLEESASELVLEYFEYKKQHIPSSHYRPMLPKMLARECKLNAILRQPDGDNELVIIKQCDVEKSIKDEFQPTKDIKLTEVAGNLNQLVGLEKVKIQIKELSALVKMEQLRQNSSFSISLNSLFLGNPGTGKTTVAESYGQIFKSIGVLPLGHVVTVKRHDIVGQYIGQTARNMKKYIDQAFGGILFIDEAYALYKPDNEKDYGHEAIDTLVAELELIRDKTCVILAGYPNKMMRFLDSNPGLASRFPNTINFEDYSSAEMLTILERFILSGGYHLERGALVLLQQLLEDILHGKDTNFGNARECRNLYEKLKLVQAVRLIYSENQQGMDLNLFSIADVRGLVEFAQRKDLKEKARTRIGF